MKNLILVFTIFATITSCVISCMAPKTEETAAPASDTLVIDSAMVDTLAVDSVK